MASGVSSVKALSESNAVAFIPSYYHTLTILKVVMTWLLLSPSSTSTSSPLPILKPTPPPFANSAKPANTGASSWEIAVEYSNATRAISRALLEGVSESLGSKLDAIIEHTGFDYGYQKLQLNLYPPCPEPELALGLPPHTDNGFFHILIQNGINGLQPKHDCKWINVNPLPNSLIVNTGDQLEIVSNGRYKGVWYRAVLNEKEARVSVGAANGPEVEKEMGPEPELLKKEKEKPLFKSMTYLDYVRLQRKVICATMPRGLEAIRIS